MMVIKMTRPRTVSSADNERELLLVGRKLTSLVDMSVN